MHEIQVIRVLRTMLIEMAGAQVGSKLLLGSAEINKCLFLVPLPLGGEGKEVYHTQVRFANML